MKISIYLSNLAKYVEGNENGKWLQLPMEKTKLTEVFNNIVGKNQEWIILDYNAPFHISEYENVFSLNEMMENLQEVDDTTAKIIFKIVDDKDDALRVLETLDFVIIDADDVSKNWNTSLPSKEIYGMVLNDQGFNHLFKQPIPEEMIDYINFSQVWETLSVDDGWYAVTTNDATYLVSVNL